MIRTYSELRRLQTIEERFRYLTLRGNVGEKTFGFERHLNQTFYRSAEWRQIRNVVILRDNGCDLGIDGYEIHDRVIIHHMNPMVVDDFRNFNPDVLNPEYLITVSHNTHNAIHYGDEHLLPRLPVERRPGDTKLW